MTHTDEQNCARLLEYLRSILFDQKIQPLDLMQLDPSFRQLGRGMQVLQTMVEETQTYSEELARGNLSVRQPDKDNLLCTNLKSLHAILNHLTWQAKQVAAGDYSQHVSYLGEFSDAFNTMTRQLQEREGALRRETERIRQHSEALSSKAYLDPLTSVHNRAFFAEYLERVLRDRQTVTLGYLDLDGLKYVNDHYGHAEGDRYITRFTGLLRDSFRRDDVIARIGGDEFCILIRGDLVQLVREKLEHIRASLLLEQVQPYPMSFSYGICTLNGAEECLNIEEVLQKADAAMYHYKRSHKQARP